MSKYVIFSVDNADNLHALAKAMRYLDTIQAMQGTTVINCVNCWEGVLEQSFVCTAEVFHTYVKNSPFTKDQEAYLYIQEGYRHVYGSVWSWDGEELLDSGVVFEVTKEEALSSQGWTYRPDINTYWVMK